MTPSVSRLALFLGIILNVLKTGYGLSAAFFGDGHIHLPLDDSSSETNLQLQFRTSRSDGLLFLAAGSTDYCVIELVDGKVRVHINLGFGDTTLGSPPGVVYNDLQWHNLDLQRSQNKIRLTIDNIYPEETTTAGTFFELNIDKGLFLGGVGSSFNPDVFFGNYKYFRGCLQGVQFNSVDVFHAARQQVEPMNVYGVEWECSAEFSATSDQPISFLHNTSFVSFPSLQTRQDVRIMFDIKTRADRALLVYNSGRSADSDIFALEIVRGSLKLTVNKGDGFLEVISRRLLNDGVWHQVEVVVDRINAHLTVDGHRKESRLNFGDNIFLDLHGSLFVGGVGAVARSFAIHQSLHSLHGSHAAEGSFIGCLHNFKVDGRLLGFREASVSRGLRPECVWTYPCMSSPCVDGATCEEEGFYYYRCLCHEGNCFKTGATGEGEAVTPISDIVHVQDIVLREGSHVALTTSNIDLITSPAEHDIRDSAVVFRVTRPPDHGNITVDGISIANQEVIFTLLDLTAMRVRYSHDGSEEGSDSFGLQLEFLDTTEETPDIFRNKYGFTLMVRVAPWNDKPDIVLPNDDTLVLVENTQLYISAQDFTVIDNDDPPQRLAYTIQYQPGYNIGYFELSDALGVRARITSFTQEDIEAKKIRYVHRGSRHQQLRIQVSDGKDISDPRILKIHAVPLRLSVLQNTGLVTTNAATTLIHRDNLTFTTNSRNHQFDIHYEITDPPYFGEIQKQQYTDNSWGVVSTFTQDHIDNSRLRYVHNGDERSTGDYLVFRASTMNVQSESYEFEIRVIETRAYLERNLGLVLEGLREGTITRSKLHAASSVPSHSASEITYRIIATPRYGHLIKLVHSPNKIRKKRLNVGSNITQADIDANNIVFRFHRTLYDPIDDNFEFQILIPGHMSNVSIFALHYSPAKSDVHTINNGLNDVVEGSSKVITPEDLFIEMSGADHFQFTVIGGPHHGVLQIVNPSTGNFLDRNTSMFTSDDVQALKVFYRHDDSENPEDVFRYIATPVFEETDDIIQELQELSGNFEIRVLLRNDNPPEILTHKVFTVVANQGKIISTDDIEFYDPDVNYDSNALRYILHDVPVGEFLLALNHSIRLEEFTQQQLVNGEVYYRHSGPHRGTVTIWVSDGDLYTTEGLEIEASQPYVRLVNNTGLRVEKGSFVPVLPSNLSVQSNMDVDFKHVRIVITEPPMYGFIKKSGLEKARFNFHDMRENLVIYEHDDSDNLNDHFSFTIRVHDLTVEGRVNVRVTLANHLSPPKVDSNRDAAVDQLGVLILSTDILNISHPDTPPSEIIYTITTYPSYGILSLVESDTVRLSKFSQEDVDTGKLQYQNIDGNHDRDIFLFDVTNGVTSLQGLDKVIDIVPTIIPMDVVNFSIKEGESQLIGNDIIQVRHKYFLDQPLQFFIVKYPSHAQIVDYDDPEVPITQFSDLLLRAFKVQYMHDGSDTTEDEFDVQVRLVGEDRQSNPHTVYVAIMPTNDQSPEMINNNKLSVWAGSTTPITRDHLLAVDNDTLPDGLMYSIGDLTHGSVALRDHPSETIKNFTQAHIDRGDVIFIHRGAISFMFSFEVSDGANTPATGEFNIQAFPLTMTIVNNEPLRVYPGVVQPLSPANLLVTTNDLNQTRPVVFSLITKFSNGKLVRDINGSWEEVVTFWQEQVDRGEIAYQNTGATGGWLDTDTCQFDVNTAYAPSIDGETFSVLISFENINRENRWELLDVHQGLVEEGSSIFISKDHLDNSRLRRTLEDSTLWSPEANYVITKIPRHGSLTLDANNVTVGTKFTQRSINKGSLAYTHDHSDTLWDSFEFVIEIETAGQTPEERKYRRTDYVNVFNISVDAINDQPFELVTTYPGIEVVQGFTKLIGQKQLRTLDPDTPPSEIMYEIQSPPNNGYVATESNLRTPIKKFTQDDVNGNRIYFVQDGSKDSGAFYFKVTDGRYKPLFKVFNIRVHPLKLDMVNVSDIMIHQGRVSVILTRENFDIHTNGKRHHVWYNVTKAPMFGQLYMHNSPVHQFSQRDIDQGNVAYIQTDLSGMRDQFDFILYDMQNISPPRQIAIRVKSQVTQSEEAFHVLPGQHATILKSALDATSLAASTKSNPVFWVTEAPSHGVLRVSPRLRGKRNPKRRKNHRRKHKDQIDLESLPEITVMNFTHTDILQGLVKYEAKPTNASAPLEDKFVCVVTAKNSQPARLTFPIIISTLVVAPSSTVLPSAAPSKEPMEEPATPPPAGSKGSKGQYVDTMSMDHLMIVCLVCAITLVVIVVLIVVKCLKRKRKKEALRYNAECMKEDSKTPLAGPQVSYDDLAPKNNIPVINVTSDSDVGSICSSASRSSRPAAYTTPKSPDVIKTEFSRTVPTCKVTPLLEDEEGEAKSPSGKQDQLTFDWENIDPELLQHCRTTNPVLHNNKYWV